MICKMDYNNEIGFNYAKKAQCTSDDNIILINFLIISRTRLYLLNI